MRLAGTVVASVSYTRGRMFEQSFLFINIFVTKFNGFSKTFRENSNIIYFLKHITKVTLLALIPEAPFVY